MRVTENTGPMEAPDRVRPPFSVWPPRRWSWPVAASLVLVWLSTQNFLVFHILAEAFAAVMCLLIFMVVVHTHEFSRNHFAMFLACGYFWVGVLDTVHTLSYEGLDLLRYAGYGASSQYWIAARALEAGVLLTAASYVERRHSPERTFIAFGALTVLLTALVTGGYVPDTVVDGTTLTRFKVVAELAVIATLVAALARLARIRERLGARAFGLLATAIGLTIGAEAVFTLYDDVLSAAIVTGHLLKLFSLWVVLLAVAHMSMREPYLVLSRLAEVSRRTQLKLEHSHAELETRISERTQALDREAEDRRQAEDALRASEAHKSAILESALDAIVTMDSDGQLRELNPAAEAMFGYTRGEALGRKLADLIIPPEHREAHRAGLARYLSEGRSTLLGRIIETEAQRRDGSRFPVELAVVPTGRDRDTLFSANIRDISSRRRSEERIRHMATHDTLTDLPDRSLLADRLGQALASARRRGNRTVVLFVDLDGFKGVNDRHGHDAGDCVLREAARRLRGSVRESDTVCRYGGDEFVIVLPELSREADGVAVAEKVIDALHAPYPFDGEELQVGASAGIAWYPEHGLSAEALLRQADAAMYRAKVNREQRYCVAEV